MKPFDELVPAALGLTVFLALNMIGYYLIVVLLFGLSGCGSCDDESCVTFRGERTCCCYDESDSGDTQCY